MPPAPRVLVAHPSPDLYGSDKQLLESVHGLRAAGARVLVALPGPGPLAEELVAAGARWRATPVPVLRKALLRPRGLARLAAGGLRGAAPALALARAADVVLVNTVTVPLWLAAARAAGTPALAHVHEAEEDAGRALRTALVAPLLLADRVLVNSRAAQRFVLDAAPRLGGRVRVLHNGVPGPPAALRPPRERLDGPIELVLVGRLSPRKGTDVAVRAVRALAAQGVDARLTLVGAVFPGYEWFEQELRALGGDDGRVRFAGFRRDVWPYLEAADVVLVPSRAEPFGNVAVEGLLAGRPVVASAVQGLVEIVEPGATGSLVEPGDPGALAAAVRDLVGDWAAVRARAARTPAIAAARFGTQRYRRDVADEVLALATRRPRRTG